jgi:Ca2+-transporting ATPase
LLVLRAHRLGVWSSSTWNCAYSLNTVSEDRPEPAAWHALSARTVLARLESDGDAGLREDEAAARLTRCGPNAIPDQRRRSVFTLFVGQFRDFMILVLLGAAVVSGVIGEPQDTIAIVVIVLINAVI